MAKQGAHISDVDLLVKLDQRIGASGQAMANIDQSVVSHLNNVRDTLERQLDVIREKLQEAEQRSNEAESACQACHASQFCDEFGMVVPSCASEESAVEVAQMEVEKWRSKYEQGQQILGECQREMSDYNAGGHALIENMCDQQAKAQKILHIHINNLQDILGTAVGSMNIGETAGIGALVGISGVVAASKFSQFYMGRDKMSIPGSGMGGVEEPEAVLSKNVDETTLENWRALSKNNRDLENALGIKQGKPMTIEDADMQKANPHYGEGDEYSNNCATAVNAYALRLRGFDVTAKGNKGSSSIRNYVDFLEDRTSWVSSHDNVFKVWKNADGSNATPKYTADWMKDNGIDSMTGEDYKKYFEETCKEEGVYILGLKWKGGTGHATILQRDKDGLHLVEPQAYDSSLTTDGRRDIDDLLFHVRNGESGLSKYPGASDGIMRVDDKIFNPKYVDLFEVNK